MRTWRVALPGGERCGYLFCPIPEGRPVQLIQIKGLPPKLRCEAHADGPVDWDQIERAAIASEGDELTPKQYAARVTRVSRPRPRTPLAPAAPGDRVPFDGKAAAVSRND